MSHLNLLLKPVIAVSMLALLVSACSVGPSNVTPPPQSTEFTSPELKKAVARVNGTEITLGELKRAEKILMAKQPGAEIPPHLKKEFEKQALNQLISSELLFQAGQKLEVKDLDKQSADRFEKIKGGFADANAYAKELQNIGMDEKMLRDYTRRDLVIANFVNTNIASKVTVSEGEIKTFYDQNPTNFVKPEQLRASHILVSVDSKAGADDKNKARERAEKLHKELVNGANFVTLAKENSSCPSSKQGGDLGYFTKGKMVPQFEQAAFALEVGGLSGVVETQFGFHIIKLTDRTKAETTPLSAVNKKIEEYIKAQKINAAIGDFVGKARQDAKIEML
ncbi:MAG: peptidylprolyl isomerase [Geobacteraceae bacterium]|nr:peptidylprolyl isomerase [Geobacteraceae bacterium]NTW79643.1 peptidylprolyl isomerase [Geobacteraceae bacterium]